jgi:cation:H+ antiporter
LLIDVALLAAGLVVLYYGAEWLVRGSSNISYILGVNPVVIGLTVVAFGTSLPELMVCLVAMFRESNDIAVGNVIGSNIANIGLVLATGAFLFPITIQRRTSRREIPIMFLFLFVFIGMSLDGALGKLEGFILFSGLIAFTLYCARTASMDDEEAKEVVREAEDYLDKRKSLQFETFMTTIGIMGVLAGAYLLVESATAIARALHISEMVIGMTVVAVGTSLPELATTVVAAFRKHSDIAVGNVIGSNIFNIGSVMGLTALAYPVSIAHETLRWEMMVMLAFSLAIIPSAVMGKMGRVPAGIVLTCYFLFIFRQAGIF